MTELRNCPITMEEIKDQFTLSCAHVFEKEAIHNWLKNNNTCPICRTLQKIENNIENVQFNSILFDLIIENKIIINGRKIVENRIGRTEYGREIIRNENNILREINEFFDDMNNIWRNNNRSIYNINIIEYSSSYKIDIKFIFDQNLSIYLETYYFDKKYY